MSISVHSYLVPVIYDLFVTSITISSVFQLLSILLNIIMNIVKDVVNSGARRFVPDKFVFRVLDY